MKKVTIFLSLLLTLILLQGCHGSSSSNNSSTVRLVNGTPGTLDMYWSGSGAASAVASAGSASSSVAITAGIPDVIQLAINGGNPSGETPISFGGGYSYTIIGYLTYPTAQPVWNYIIDDQVIPASGEGQLGIADYSGSGNLDVYIGQGSGTPTLWTPPGGTSGSNTNYSQLAVPNAISQNYHIQITGHNGGYNGTDVRLDIPSLTIGNQQILTLVLLPTIGGGLIDGLAVVQQGQTLLTGQSAVTPFKNYSARVRLVADYDPTAGIGNITTANATTAATTGGGIPLAYNLSSPNVGNYAVVPLTSGAATTPLNIALSVSSGGSVANYTGSVIPGQDYTLMAYGNVSTVPALLVDDNTLASSGQAKLRLVNGVNSVTSSITLDYNTSAVSSAKNIALGSASASTSVAAPGGSPYSINVIGGVTFQVPTTYLQSRGVYTLFMLGNTTSTSGTLSPDHTSAGP